MMLSIHASDRYAKFRGTPEVRMVKEESANAKLYRAVVMTFPAVPGRLSRNGTRVQAVGSINPNILIQLNPNILIQLNPNLNPNPSPTLNPTNPNPDPNPLISPEEAIFT
eukprot:1375414-Amorphochlora_amoeboformis.AAC.1